MTSDYIIVPIKLSVDVGNDKYIILCTFGSRIMSGFEGKQGDLQTNHPAPKHSSGKKSKKSSVWIGWGIFFWQIKIIVVI